MSFFGGSSKNKGKGKAKKVKPIPGYEAVILRDEEQKTRFLKLIPVDMTPTRFLSTTMAQRFGMADELRKLFLGTGLGRFYGMSELSYRNLTLEFLSSFEVDQDSRSLSYRLFGVTVDTDVNTFAGHFGIPPPNDLDPDCKAEELWVCLTGRDPSTYDVSKLRISAISDPRIRLWFRTLMGTLFGRGNFDCTNKGELGILGSYLNINGGDDYAIEDIPYMFAYHLQRVATCSNMRHICIGGLITYLARTTTPFDGSSEIPLTSEVPMIDAFYLSTTTSWVKALSATTFEWVKPRLPLPAFYLPPIKRRGDRTEDGTRRVDRPSFVVLPGGGIGGVDATGGMVMVVMLVVLVQLFPRWVVLLMHHNSVMIIVQVSILTLFRRGGTIMSE